MDLPVIDLSPYLEIAGKSAGDSTGLSDHIDPEYRRLCLEVSRSLRETGALLVKDPRCSAEDNDRFIDMMERYFERPEEFKRLQERRHLHYQVIGSITGVRLLIDTFPEVGFGPRLTVDIHHGNGMGLCSRGSYNQGAYTCLLACPNGGTLLAVWTFRLLVQPHKEEKEKMKPKSE